MPNFVPGLDLSFSPTSANWWLARKSDGFRAMSQCLWTGGAQTSKDLEGVAEANILNAVSVGFAVSGYINASPWFDGEDAIDEAARIAGQGWPHLPVLFVDVEIDGLDEDRIKTTCEAAKRTGKRVGLYSAKWFWDKLGNPQWDWLLEYPLWVADYDGDLNPQTAALFGPYTYTDVVGKQYQGTATLDKVDVDYDVFDLDFWEDDMPISPQEWQQIATADNNILTLFNQFRDDVLNVVGTIDSRLKSVEGSGAGDLSQELANIKDRLDNAAAALKPAGQ